LVLDPFLEGFLGGGKPTLQKATVLFSAFVPMPSGDDKNIDGVEDIIRLRIDDLKTLPVFNRHDLSTAVRSAVKRINGFPWYLAASIDEDDDFVVAVVCDKNVESLLWCCKFEAEVVIVNQANALENFVMSLRKFLDNRTFSDWVSTLDMHTLMLASEGFIKDGEVVVEARIKVRGESGDRFKLRETIDFFSPSRFSDVILVVEGKKLHLSSQILARHSSYFEALLYGGFKESMKDKETEMPDVDLMAFLTLLHLVYATGDANLNEGNVEAVLELADKFDATRILIEVEQFLIDQNPDFNLPLRLHMANKYKLTALQGNLMLKRSWTADDFKKIRQSDRYFLLSREAVDALFDRMIERGIY
ncbi:hypothetical protein PFISCL1PPCAC_21056, partial [Pristionchus fissidentatus]